MSDWNLQKARDCYSIQHWSDGYFDINEHGHIMVRPERDSDHTIDLYDLSRKIQAQGLTLPVLVRFNAILHDRVQRLYSAFGNAMQESAYEGGYTAVYPIKVNQQHSVIEELLRNKGHDLGLEAGSKPELMAVLGLAGPHNATIVCNGYKDSEYIRLALIGRLLGYRIFIVIEKLSELATVIRESRQLGVEPLLGVRLRLASIGSGNWQNSGGEKAKFGLSSAQLLMVIEQLREAGMLDCLQLIHFHMGSQIANIRDIRGGMHEVTRYYAELHSLGVPVGYVDVGGGLGVDYEGNRSRSSCSMNYTTDEYARNIVRALADICQQNALPQPHIISESGRAMSAHHAVLITNVTDREQVGTGIDFELDETPTQPILHELNDIYTQLLDSGSNGRSLLEYYHDTVHWLNESRSQFLHGMLDLQGRADAERLYLAICKQLRRRLRPSVSSHRRVLDELNEKLADKYFCNFSLFQSVPDIWGIKQIFPIAPLHRLLEEPGCRAVLEDITCDSDGRIDQFVEDEGIESTLALHKLNEGEPYLLGLFMLGAYQEILGDMHNLFGDTDSVNVQMLEDGAYRLENAMHGDTVTEVLDYVHIDADFLRRRYQERLQAAGMSAEQYRQCAEELEAGLNGYTYLED